MRVAVALIAVAIFAFAAFSYFGSNSNESRPIIYTIGVINYSPAGVPALDGLKAGLKDLGYAEGVNLEFINSGVIRDKVKLLAEARRLNSLKPDLIYAISTPAALVAKEATQESKIPVVFGPVSSPVRTGIVKSLSHPGGNVTGVSFGPQEPRRLEMLTRIIPWAKTIYVPYNPNDRSARKGIERLRPPSTKLGIKMILAELLSKEDLEQALGSFPAEVDAIFVPTDSLMVSMTPRLVKFANSMKIPLTTPQREGVAAGALYSYGFSIAEVGRQAARLVSHILKGARPDNLPVELSEFVLAVNLVTAESIGVTIPDELLRHAVVYRK